MPARQAKAASHPKFVEVALPVPLRQLFTYRLPAGYADIAKLGSRVLVPFGRRTLTGYIAGFQDEFEERPDLHESDLKDITRLLDEDPLLTAEILELTHWAADYYATSWGEMLKASLPAGINAATERIVSITDAGREELLKKPAGSRAAKWAFLEYIVDNGRVAERDFAKTFGRGSQYRISRLIRNGYIAADEVSITTKVRPKLRKAVRLTGHEPGKELTDQQEAVIHVLADAGGEMLFTELLEKAKIGASPVNTLAKRGVLEVFVQEVRRDPFAGEAIEEPSLELTLEQGGVLSQIENAIKSDGYESFLLHGVTGSGKTEVYIRAMQTAMKQGKSALMLVPEIALTPVFSRQLRGVFGDDVAILHSNLSDGERFDEWRRIRSGDARVVIGTRSAVFAPLKELGLIIVDEEHDASYRQDESPYYNARDVAVVRANKLKATVVLGSATPAIETFFNAQNGKYKYLELPNRIGGRPMARAELIDMREVFKRAGMDVVLAPQLASAIDETYARGEQTIILLNRRGFSSFVLCRSCGETLKCKNCDITMTFHRTEDRLICHYCAHTVRTPTQCPFCKSEFLYFIGHGTEQVEDILRKRFPRLKIARIDRDTMSRKGELAKTLNAFDRGEIDMLIGTQMIAKGHDFHNVTLVGVISVDTGLGMPDLRSAERTFQLLTQVAGRAGRGVLPGRVLIQTYYPEHYALRHAVVQDYAGFYAEELRYRERLGYPPFVVLASVMLTHRDLEYTMKSARILRDALDRANSDRTVRILGPAQASIARLKGKYRQQIIIKSPTRKELRSVIGRGLAEAETRGADLRSVQVEIDPVNLM